MKRKPLHPPEEPALTRADSSTTDLARNLPLGELLALGAQFSADLTPEALLHEVAESICKVLDYPQVYVRLRNTDTDELEAVAFAGVEAGAAEQLRARPVAPAFYQKLLHARYRVSDSYLIPADLQTEAQAEEQILFARRDATLLVPLRGRGDRLIGVIYVVPPPGPPPALPDVQRLEVIARQASLSLENARLAARTARLLAKEQLLAELGRDVSTTLDLDEILNRTVGRLEAAFRSGSITLRNKQDELEVAAAIGPSEEEIGAKLRLKVGEGITGWVVQHGVPFLTNDVHNETRVRPPSTNFQANQYIRSYIAVPLRSGGSVIGSLNVESLQVNAFTYEDVDLLEAVAAQIGGPIASARLYQEAQHLARQVARRNEHLTVLNAIARTAVSTLDLERMLERVITQIQQGFGYGHVELYLVDDSIGELVIAAQAGRQGSVPRDYRQLIDTGLMGRTVRTGRTVRADDVLLEPDFVGASGSDTRSQLCVPIVAGGRALAVLNLESNQVASFTDEDVAVLETVADVLASAIENARLYQRAQEAAVLEERSRLARDLHDSISQQLFSMTLTAQAARAHLEKNPARAASQLERLQETAQAALSEMRALIFQLRPPALTEQGLIAALHQHVAALGRREGLTVNLTVTGDGEERFARGVEQALYRIVQEALNNVVRHAGACYVNVELHLEEEQIRLRISDDGRGFDPAKVTPSDGRHLGLISMRERASELGGRLEVRSQPSKGTEISLIVPNSSTR
jgi:signal transduction histidine kinase